MVILYIIAGIVILAIFVIAHAIGDEIKNYWDKPPENHDNTKENTTEYPPIDTFR